MVFLLLLTFSLKVGVVIPLGIKRPTGLGCSLYHAVVALRIITHSSVVCVGEVEVAVVEVELALGTLGSHTFGELLLSEVSTFSFSHLYHLGHMLA